jgi:hypothetical protein
MKILSNICENSDNPRLTTKNNQTVNFLKNDENINLNLNVNDVNCETKSIIHPNVYDSNHLNNLNDVESYSFNFLELEYCSDISSCINECKGKY